MQDIKKRGRGMKEKDLKLAVSQYLEYKTNLGELYADRLNSGAVYVKRGDRTYGVQLCREGTADFIVIRARRYFNNAPQVITPEIIFLELKGEKGRTSPTQDAFKILVEAQGASYAVIRSMEELEVVLEI